MGTAVCESRPSKRNRIFAFPSFSSSANLNGRIVVSRGAGIYPCLQIGGGR